MVNLWSTYGQLTTLDVTQNTLLEKLYCDSNQITGLDVTQNTTLTHLSCRENKIPSLNLTQNPALTLLRCWDNLLTSLDVSSNPNLLSLDCSLNLLNCLNVKNGNNSNFTYFSAPFNPSLTCIEVDNVTYSNTNWTGIDAGASFSTNCGNRCSLVGIEEKNLSISSLYPNPTSGQLSISLEEANTTSVTIRNSLGQLVLSDKYPPNNQLDLDISTYPNGIYFLQIEVNGEIITKKVIKQ